LNNYGFIVVLGRHVNEYGRPSCNLLLQPSPLNPIAANDEALDG